MKKKIIIFGEKLLILYFPLTNILLGGINSIIFQIIFVKESSIYALKANYNLFNIEILN